jgi:DNA polymerase
MLDPKQIRMLQLLDKQVSNCSACALHRNGRCIPHWGKKSKYVIIGEAPGFGDIRKQTFFNGGSGNLLISELGLLGFKSSQFLMINSIQCKPSGAKPSEEQLACCQSHIRKYIRVLRPEKILCLGNYGKYIFTGNTVGVLSQRGKFDMYSFDDNSSDEYPVLFTIHPAYCVYNEEEGLPMLREDLKLFKKSEFERQSDWLLSEEDFLV